MHENDPLTDLRDRVTDIRSDIGEMRGDIRALSRLVITVSQMGERMLALQEEQSEHRSAIASLAKRQDKLERRPLREVAQKARGRSRFRDALVTGATGAFGGSIPGAIILLVASHSGGH